ncbi:MAG TPA: hypothetical protein VK012_02960, partial [Gemmatimonadales bacterium]|nr:hypothetical protein [Gemmatimonadales bacterium]
MIVARLRRGLSGMAAGGPVAATWPSGSNWPGADAAIRPARLIDGGSVTHHPVGSPEPLDDRVAFVDGTQRMELLGYVGTAPIVVAEVRAAVRERKGGRLTTVISERAVMAIGRPAALAAAGGLLDGLERIGIEEGPPHPYRDFTEARRAVDRIRGNAELHAAERYRQESDAWLILDGSLSGSPALAVDPRAIGIVKSHAVL